MVGVGSIVETAQRLNPVSQEGIYTLCDLTRQEICAILLKVTLSRGFYFD